MRLLWGGGSCFCFFHRSLKNLGGWGVGELLPPLWINQWNYFEVGVVPPSRQWVYKFIHTHQYFNTYTMTHSESFEKTKTREMSHRIKVHGTNSQDKRKRRSHCNSPLWQKSCERSAKTCQSTLLYLSFKKKNVTLTGRRKEVKGSRKSCERGVPGNLCLAQSNGNDHTHIYDE